MKDFILKLVESSVKYEKSKDYNFEPTQEWLKKEFCAMKDILDVKSPFMYFDEIAEKLKIQ